LNGSRQYYDYKERCIYCDIIKQELDNQERIIIKKNGFVAFCPFASRFPFEIWVTPLTHNCDFEGLLEERIPDLSEVLKEVFMRLRCALNDPPYNYVLHTAPFRRAKAKAGYWRTILEDYHWHIEIMPRLTGVAGFEWGTGFYINPTPPEEAARYLREITI
jgi:UDPglucose--hexose-1-phosphate uridylyltransferase